MQAFKRQVTEAGQEPLLAERDPRAGVDAEAEAAAIGEIVKRIAIAFPHVRFSLSGTDRTPLDLPAADLAGRLAQVLGEEVKAEVLPAKGEKCPRCWTYSEKVASGAPVCEKCQEALS